MPVSPCSRVADRIAARCAHADLDYGWCMVNERGQCFNGMVGQTLRTMTKLFVEAAGRGSNAMGVLTGRKPPSSFLKAWRQHRRHRARSSGQRSARASFWRQMRPDAVHTSYLSHSLSARDIYDYVVECIGPGLF